MWNALDFLLLSQSRPKGGIFPFMWYRWYMFVLQDLTWIVNLIMMHNVSKANVFRSVLFLDQGV